MDDLRWVLLVVGAVVVVAIYLSSRFENEDWSRERKQFAKNKAGRSGKKLRRKKVLPTPKFTPEPVVAQAAVKKEPSMNVSPAVTEKPVVEEPIVEKPIISELVIEVTAQDDNPVSEISALEISPAENVTSPEKKPVVDDKNDREIPAEETTKDTVETENEELSVKEPVTSAIEDDITEVEIPVGLAAAEAQIRIADIVEDEVPPEKLALDIEPLVLSVVVLADEEEVFNGQEIKEALEAEGLRHGAMSIFHLHDPNNNNVTENDDAVFSVANVLEPGFFDLDKLEEINTPGLMLFCQLPGPLPGEDALELMLDKGRGLAVRLHGHMCDEKRNRFTTQAKNHYLDRISTFNREVTLARSKTPVG